MSEICLEKWFCERGESAKLTLKDHPTVNNLVRDTLVAYQLAGHTALSLILAYCTTVVAKCFRRSPKAGNEPSEERVTLLYFVSRFIVIGPNLSYDKKSSDQ